MSIIQAIQLTSILFERRDKVVSYQNRSSYCGKKREHTKLNMMKWEGVHAAVHERWETGNNAPVYQFN